LGAEVLGAEVLVAILVLVARPLEFLHWVVVRLD
jgi:hypothetical protein